MSTPASLKRIEQAKKRKAMQQNQSLSNQGGYNASFGPRGGAYRYAQTSYLTGQPVGSIFNAPLDPNATGLDFTSDVLSSESEFFQVEQTEEKFLPVPVPINVTVDYAISPQNIVCFYGTRHFLSPLFPSLLVIENNTYPSVEHYYQACKVYTLAGPQFAIRLSNIRDPVKCKMETKNLLRNIVNNKKVDEWKMKSAPEVLMYALLHKFKQNAALGKQLQGTSGKILAHTFEKDKVFATGCNADEMKKWAESNKGTSIKLPVDVSSDGLVGRLPQLCAGKNLLGVLLMQVRDALGGPPERVHPNIQIMLKSIR